MTRVFSSVTLMLGVIIALSGMTPVQSGMMGGQMGQSRPAPEAHPGGMAGSQMTHGMMGGGRQDMPMERRMSQPSQLVRMLKAELELSDDQGKQLTQIFLQAMKSAIKQRADLRIAELELRELLAVDPVDMTQVETMLQAVERQRTSLRLSLIKAHEQAKGILSPEQRQKLEHLHDRLPGMMGPGMMGMMRMMGEAGTGGMGMMGERMRRQPRHPRPTPSDS